MPDGAPALRPDDRGFLYGDGAFETLSLSDGVPLALSRHRARLFECLEFLGIPLPEVDLRAALLALASANHLDEGEAIARISVSRAGGWGEIREEPPTVVAQVRPRTARDEARRAGIALRLTRGLQRALPAFKTLAWLPSLVALRAHAGGAEALLLDEQDRVLEGATSNLIVHRDGGLHTPPLDGRILPGVARALALAAAPSLGLSVVEAPLPLDALDGAPCFLTNATLPIAPVSHLEGRPLPQAPALLDALRAAMMERAGAR